MSYPVRLPSWCHESKIDECDENDKLDSEDEYPGFHYEYGDDHVIFVQEYSIKSSLSTKEKRDLIINNIKRMNQLNDEIQCTLDHIELYKSQGNVDAIEKYNESLTLHMEKLLDLEKITIKYGYVNIDEDGDSDGDSDSDIDPDDIYGPSDGIFRVIYEH